MKKLAIRLTALVALLSIAAIGAAYFLVRASLPQVDGEVLTDGVSAAVTIERDAAGIPTITANNRHDLAYATGYVHGQDRFFQMDLTRRNAAGELAELFGAAALPVDKRHRFHRFRARAQRIVDGLSPERRRLVDAYTRGVNDGVSSLGARPFEYLLTRNEPAPWRAEDAILAVYTMYMQLNDERGNRDVRRGLAHKVLPDDVFTWLYPQGTEWDAPMMGEARADAPIPGPEVYDLRGRLTASTVTAIADGGESLLPGSNNWAVAGRLTTTGAAMVANDMHLGITAPNVFYRLNLRTTDDPQIRLSGVTLPGTPFLVAGSNGHIAYGNTNSYGDWTDVVEIVPGDAPDTYLTPDGPRPFTVHHETIAVKGAEAEVLVIRETIWGPVRDDEPDPDRELAVAWIAHHPEGVTLDHLELETVRDVESALAIANRIGMPPQNFVVGDAAGNIGWTISGSIPRREGFDPQLPADWSEGGGWNGWLTAAEYPRIVNPDSGRIWTANARRVVDGRSACASSATGVTTSARASARFAMACLPSTGTRPATCWRCSWTTGRCSSRDGATCCWSRSMRQRSRDTPGVANIVRLVESWVPRASTDSVGYRLVRGFRGEVRNRVFPMLMQPVIETYGEDRELRMSNQFESPLWTLAHRAARHIF